MTRTKKIITWIVVTIIAIPALMVANNNYDAVHINFIGLAYCWIMVKIHRYVLPKWMVDYIHEDKEPENDYFDE